MNTDSQTQREAQSEQEMQQQLEVRQESMRRRWIQMLILDVDEQEKEKVA